MKLYVSYHKQTDQIQPLHPDLQKNKIIKDALHYNQHTSESNKKLSPKPSYLAVHNPICIWKPEWGSGEEVNGKPNPVPIEFSQSISLFFCSHFFFLFINYTTQKTINENHSASLSTSTKCLFPSTTNHWPDPCESSLEGFCCWCCCWCTLACPICW